MGLANANAGLLTTSGNAAGGVRRFQQGCCTERIAVCEGGLFTADRPHANALINGETAGLHNALVQAPRLRHGVLEVEVRIIDAMGVDLGQGAMKVRLCQAMGLQQQGMG